MFTTAGQLVSAFEDNYKSQITQSYNRVVDIGTVAFQFFSHDILLLSAIFALLYIAGYN